MANPETPWHAAYPAPRTAAPSVSREEVLDWLRKGSPGKDFVLVDLRRNDFEGGTIRGSLNLPAQSLFLTIPALYNLVAGSGVEKVIWYCGSSAGRGTRAAGWFADYIAEKQDDRMKSLVLTGGIKGWVAAGREYVEWMDEYEEGIWAKYQ